MGDDLDHPGARLLSASAHELRNHVATIRSVVQLVDDEEVVDALDEASRAIQVAVERAVVLARMELGERPDLVSMELSQLCSLASRRAARERGGIIDILMEPGPRVEVPGPWAERLLADLLHVGALVDVRILERVELEFELEHRDAPLIDALVALATACGGELDVANDVAVVRLPISEG